MISRPMLAATLDTDVQLSALKFPLMSSPKVDGIRCLVKAQAGPLSRSFKTIPNEHIRSALREATFLDGEIITLSAGRPDDFNTIQSKVMSHGGTPDFLFLAFDYFECPSMPFYERLQLAAWKANGLRAGPVPQLRFLPHHTCRDVADVLDQEVRALTAGFEGLMLRDPNASYKSGRSTVREQGLMKIKPFQTAEGKVFDFLPLQRNLNPQEQNELGLAKRSTAKSGRVLDNLLGALVLDIGRDAAGNRQFLQVGSGFTTKQRIEIWSNKDRYRRKLVTFKYLSHGMKDLPRHPIFLGFRHKEDTSS